MNELLPDERIESFIEKVALVAREKVLTNLDAMAILEILQRACERASNEMYEEMITRCIEAGDADDNGDNCGDNSDRSASAGD